MSISGACFLINDILSNGLIGVATSEFFDKCNFALIQLRRGVIHYFHVCLRKYKDIIKGFKFDELAAKLVSGDKSPVPRQNIEAIVLSWRGRGEFSSWRKPR